ncbi:condensation domain-containing protein, partial [Lysinibacillus sp. NPDC056185]|uniref:condensation domain-containing protein n=1 Tax=Lysinibacillus sp. NPDC056185 TaxID=3345739 RepID=UPI0039F0DB3F
VQYRDFAAWQRRHVSGERLAELLEHWRTRLDGHPPLALPTDFPRPASVDYRGSVVPFALDADTSRALRRLAAQLNVSLFSVLLTAYVLMLRAFAGQRDVVVGVPVFNRQYEQTQHLVGCFVNSLAVDFRIDDAVRVRTLIQQVAARVAEAQQHQDLPFDQLVSALRLPRDPSRHPLFQVWFDVNSFTPAEGPQARRLRAHPVDDGSERVTRFDLGVEVDASHEVLSGALTYAVALFGEDAARRFAETYTTLLGQLATVEDVSSLRWLPSGSREGVVALGRGERDGRPGSRSLGELFRAEVRAASPDAPALLLGDTPLTYRQLDEYSDQLVAGLGERTDRP